MNSLFREFTYIYASTEHYDEDRSFYLDIIKAKLLWEFHEFNAKVAAFDLTGSKPYLLIADHRETNIPRFLYQVENLKKAMKVLKSQGLEFDGEPFSLPDGPCAAFKDHSGNSFGIFEPKRPEILLKEYKKGKK